MNISKVNLNQQASQGNKMPAFKAKKTDYENPISRSTEKNLSILNTAASATAVGIIVGGLASCLGVKNAKGTNFVTKNLFSIGVGLGSAVIFTAFKLPAKIYNTKVSAFAREKEMDVFSRDRNLKSNLTEEVDKEVQNSDVSLDKKLDDNLKLQMANRGAAIGIADVTSKSQG